MAKINFNGKNQLQLQRSIAIAMAKINCNEIINFNDKSQVPIK
jgi:hypothetical protein